MKTLIVYYTLEGNAALVANELKTLLAADVCQLKPIKAYPTGGFAKFFWGGKSAVMAETPELEPLNIDLTQYDTVILGTPIWAGSITPPLRTFLKNNSLSGKNVAGYATCSGGSADKAFKQMAELSGQQLRATLRLVDPKEGKEADWKEKVREFSKF